MLSSQRGREGRLIRLLSDTNGRDLGTDFGLGVDENTALVVTSDLDGGNAVGEVMGENGVFFANVGYSSPFEDGDG